MDVARRWRILHAIAALKFTDVEQCEPNSLTMKLTNQEKRRHLRGAPGHIVDMVQEKLILWANGHEHVSRGAKRPDENVAIAVAVEIEAARNRAMPIGTKPEKSASKPAQPKAQRTPKASASRMLLD